jgi:uncharacterized protein YuzE
MQTDPRNTQPTPADDRLFVWPAADAYVKPVDQEGKRVYAIHQADGQQVAVAETREMSEDILADLGADGRLVALTLEHASNNTDVTEFSYRQVTGRPA